MLNLEVTYLNQNLEIEFKNMLTEADYTKIFESEFEADDQQKIIQSNYYFDTRDHQLKQMKSALRIRKTPSFNELTLKVPSQGFLLEKNISLSNTMCSSLLEMGLFKLSDISSDIHIETLDPEATYYLFNQFKTTRFERRIDGHLVVLDETTFQNGVVDYELEVESPEAESGLAFFHSFLEKYAIKEEKALPKIARAQQNRIEL